MYLEKIQIFQHECQTIRFVLLIVKQASSMSFDLNGRSTRNPHTIFQYNRFGWIRCRTTNTFRTMPESFLDGVDCCGIGMGVVQTLSESDLTEGKQTEGIVTCGKAVVCRFRNHITEIDSFSEPERVITQIHQEIIKSISMRASGLKI